MTDKEIFKCTMCDKVFTPWQCQYMKNMKHYARCKEHSSCWSVVK